MEPRPVPNIVANDPSVEVIDVGPPTGIGSDDCGTANMAVMPSMFGGQLTPLFRGYFQPTKAELEILNNGGYVELQMVGIVAPHSVHVQEVSSGPTSETLPGDESSL